jgi:Zn-dependent protease
MGIADNLAITAYALPLVLLAFAWHEMAHAYTAMWFGDPTPKEHGRKTLNPIKHLDPVGTIMLVVSMVLFGFPMGFAVTPVNESKMRNPRWHGAIVALAGPVTNIVLCILSAVGFVLIAESTNFDPLVQRIGDGAIMLRALYYSMIFNAFLAVFNLLPIPPLDGGRIVGAFMDDHTRAQWRKVDEYGMFIIIGLIVLGGASFSAFLNGLTDLLLETVARVLQVFGVTIG